MNLLVRDLTAQHRRDKITFSMVIRRTFFAFVWVMAIGTTVFASGFDRAPVPTPPSLSASSAGIRPAAALRGASLPAPSFFGQPSDVTADWVIGQPDFSTSTDTGPARTRVGYPMGSAYLVRGDSHFLFVCDQQYSRIMVFHNADRLANGQAAYAVIGQDGFDTGLTNRGYSAPTASTLNYPADLFVDERGDLYVADYSNNRVLIFRDPVGTDYVADSVFGQNGSFSNNTANLGGRSATGLNGPLSVTVDAERNVYIADAGNNRVLIYFDPLNTDMSADRVIGQGDSMGSGTANLGGISAASFNQPYRVRLDLSGNLYVTDINNSRGLIFNSPVEEDGVADAVIGQPNFRTGSENTGGRSSSSINQPCSLGVDAYANLYMADWGNNRVLFYKRPLAEDTVAELVFGQNDFASSDTFAASANSLWGAQRIDFDPEGNLYVSDCYNSRVLKYKIAEVAHKCPVPWMTVPQTGKSVSGNAVSVIAHLAGPSKGVTMQFQYRKEPATTWTVLGPDVPSRPYMLKWNTTATGWTDGDTVWVRAAAMSSDCDTTYSLPVRVTIKRTKPDIDESASEDHEKKEKVQKGRKVKVEIGSKVTVDIPPSTLDTDAILVTKQFDKNPKSKGPDDMKNAQGILYQSLEFDNGQSQFKDSVTLTFSYADSDQDGLIDGTDVKETTAWVYWMSSTDTDWQKIDSVSINSDSNTMTIKIAHFSYYAVFGSSSTGGDAVTYPYACVIARILPRSRWLGLMRNTRDHLLACRLGRSLAEWYYRY